ncbi:MAG: sigma-54-dependent Fis family transcriptional regulator [Candidatus Hydrogenedentes bacterium]|nr:sigma-54-dependent Fis family transcriptional regulator [Candidatus Hydrogenedentota bacterium]
MKHPRVAKQSEGPSRILLALADLAYAKTLEDFMAYERYQVERIHDAAGVLRLVSRRQFDVLVLDLELSRETDVELVSFVRQRDPGIRIILLFDVKRVEQALEGLRNGAYLYLPHSCPPSDVAMAVSRAVRSKATEASVERYEQTVFEELVGSTPAMQRVVELIRKVAPTDSTVLLLGESGTGKEVLANTLHRLSKRRNMSFIAINCAALPEALLESEMFGHVKGAFTGADRDKRGLFEEADGGTIFLDEIGDMSAITQAKLLRVLQNGEIRRVGSSVAQRVDVRVLAATNRDLIEAVRTNAFREDLYYRLNVIQIRIPPLRERRDAIPTLINHFLNQHNAKFERRIHGVEDHAMGLLMHYDYPGNVRELESIVAHAVIMAEGAQLRAQDLPDQVRFGVSPRLALPYQQPEDEAILTLAQVEERELRRALEKLEGNQTAVAKKLGISRSTLWRKMKEYGL